MTTKHKTQGIVFRKKDINEADRIFSVFTDDFGRIDIFAKAIRKTASKLRGGIDIFFLSEIEFIQGQNKKTLTDATVLEKFDNLYANIENFKIANVVGIFLDNFIKGEERDELLFALVLNIFSLINNGNLSKSQRLMVYYYFLWNALALLGYSPQLQKCIVCQDKLMPRDLYFSNILGGIICKKCLAQDKKARPISPDAVKILRLILNKDWATIFKLDARSFSLKTINDVSSEYYLYIFSSHSFEGVLKSN